MLDQDQYMYLHNLQRREKEGQCNVIGFGNNYLLVHWDGRWNARAERTICISLTVCLGGPN